MRGGVCACLLNIPVVPHKAVAEASQIANLQERLVVVNLRWQSEPTAGLKVAGVLFVEWLQWL